VEVTDVIGSQCRQEPAGIKHNRYASMTLASRAIVGTAEKCCRNQINGAGHKIPPMTRRRGDQLSRQSMTKSWFRGGDAALPQCGRTRRTRRFLRRNRHSHSMILGSMILGHDVPDFVR